MYVVITYHNYSGDMIPISFKSLKKQAVTIHIKQLAKELE